MSDPKRIVILEDYWHDLDELQNRVPKYRKTTPRWVKANPGADVIWLEPSCFDCDDKTRQWCEDGSVFECEGVGDGCTRSPVPYRKEGK